MLFCALTWRAFDLGVGRDRPNKALELSARQPVALPGLPAADCRSVGMGDSRRLTDSRPKGRGTFTGGRQLNAWSVRWADTNPLKGG